MARLLFTSFGTIALMLLDVSHGVELREITSDSEEADTSSHSAGTDIILHPGEHPAISQKQIVEILDLVLEIHQSLVNVEHEVTTSPNILEQLKQLILPKLRKLKDETSEDCLFNIERWMQKEPRRLVGFLQEVKLIEAVLERLSEGDEEFKDRINDPKFVDWIESRYVPSHESLRYPDILSLSLELKNFLSRLITFPTRPN